MAQTDQELKGNTIVLVGNFDTKQAHPDVLLKSELIRQADLVDLKIDTVVPELVILTFPWITLNVESRRLTAATTLTSPMPEPVRDFVIGFVGDQISSVITAIGINTEYHFQVPTVSRMHEIGHLLAPKQPWSNILKDPAMQTLTMRGERDDGFKGYEFVRVEPSVVLQQGVYISVNEHFEALPDEVTKKPQALLEVLETQWAKSLSRAEHIFDAIKTMGAS